MTARDEFLGLLRSARAEKLRALDIAFDRAGKRGDDLTALRKEYQLLLELPALVPATEDRAELIRLWPLGFRALPDWFRVPPEKRAAAGPAVVVDCRPPPLPPPPPEPVSMIEGDLGLPGQDSEEGSEGA